KLTQHSLSQTDIHSTYRSNHSELIGEVGGNVFATRGDVCNLVSSACFPRRFRHSFALQSANRLHGLNYEDFLRSCRRCFSRSARWTVTTTPAVRITSVPLSRSKA